MIILVIEWQGIHNQWHLHVHKDSQGHLGVHLRFFKIIYIYIYIYIYVIIKTTSINNIVC